MLHKLYHKSHIAIKILFYRHYFITNLHLLMYFTILHNGKNFSINYIKNNIYYKVGI